MGVGRTSTKCDACNNHMALGLMIGGWLLMVFGPLIKSEMVSYTLVLGIFCCVEPSSIRGGNAFYAVSVYWCTEIDAH